SQASAWEPTTARLRIADLTAADIEKPRACSRPMGEFAQWESKAAEGEAEARRPRAHGAWKKGFPGSAAALPALWPLPAIKQTTCVGAGRGGLRLPPWLPRCARLFRRRDLVSPPRRAVGTSRFVEGWRRPVP